MKDETHRPASPPVAGAGVETVPMDAVGRRAHRRSLLLLFVGLPVAWLLSGVWSFLVGTSDPDGAPTVVGLQAALYESPTYLLLVGLAGWSVLEATRAHRHRARGAGWGLVASCLGLFAALAMVGTVAADNAVSPHEPALNLAVAVLAGVLAATAYGWARLRTRRRAAAERSSGATGTGTSPGGAAGRDSTPPLAA